MLIARLLAILALVAGGLCVVLEDVAAATAPPLLTQAQLADVEKYVDKHGRKAVVDPDASSSLGLGKASDTVTVDQVSLRDKDKPANRHILDRLSGSSGFLVVRQTGEVRALYRVDKDLALVKAIVVRLKTPGPAVSQAEAEKSVRAELQIWAAVAHDAK